PSNYNHTNTSDYSWYDVDDPKDKSDWETYKNITDSGLQICENIKDIECRAVDYPDKTFDDFVAETGQVVTCDQDIGLICRAEDQTRPPRKCFDYEIRVYCCNICTTCAWSGWYDVDDPKDKSDWETYKNITDNSGLQICENIKDIECRAVDYPDKTFDDFVAETGQVVTCDQDIGLICVGQKTRPDHQESALTMRSGYIVATYVQQPHRLVLRLHRHL
uniref:WxxW domain-containing protein n=1 Tax=Oreochromis aureus TaxID=47969 RepID=A0AAZ1Y550_OREAU